MTHVQCFLFPVVHSRPDKEKRERDRKHRIVKFASSLKRHQKSKVWLQNRAEELVREAAGKGANIILLQVTCLSSTTGATLGMCLVSLPNNNKPMQSSKHIQQDSLAWQLVNLKIYSMRILQAGCGDLLTGSNAALMLVILKEDSSAYMLWYRSCFRRPTFARTRSRSSSSLPSHSMTIRCCNASLDWRQS